MKKVNKISSFKWRKIKLLASILWYRKAVVNTDSSVEFSGREHRRRLLLVGVIRIGRKTHRLMVINKIILRYIFYVHQSISLCPNIHEHSESNSNSIDDGDIPNA